MVLFLTFIHTHILLMGLCCYVTRPVIDWTSDNHRRDKTNELLTYTGPGVWKLA